MRRVCPLCALRSAAVIDPECVVCHGTGIIDFTAHALREYPAETLSTAVHLALEQTARDIDTRPDARNVDPRPAIDRTLNQLKRAGIIRHPKAPDPVPTEPTGTKTTSPAVIVRMATGTVPDMTDQRMIRAYCYPYRYTDRPGARGLPLFSRNFHPSSLARIGDPQPFDVETADELDIRRKRRYDAKTILHYVSIRSPL